MVIRTAKLKPNLSVAQLPVVRPRAKPELPSRALAVSVSASLGPARPLAQPGATRRAAPPPYNALASAPTGASLSIVFERNPQAPKTSYFGPAYRGGLPEAMPSRAPWTEITVQKGDTLYGIAKDKGVKPELIVALSELENVHLLKVGQRLRIPDASIINHPDLVQAGRDIAPGLRQYDKQYAQYRQAQAQQHAQQQANQASARALSAQAGLPAGQIPAEPQPLSAAAAPNFAAKLSVPPSAAPTELGSHFAPGTNPDLSAVFANPHYVVKTQASLTKDRMHASIHNHMASTAGALEAVSGAAAQYRPRLSKDQSLAKNIKAVVLGSPLVAALGHLSGKVDAESYFRAKRFAHDGKAHTYEQQIELKGGVNEWAQVNVKANGWSDMVNYGHGLVIGTLPVLLEAAAGGWAGRSLAAAGWFARGGAGANVAVRAKTIQRAGALGAVGGTTVSSLGALLDAQRDQTGGLIHLRTAAALTPLFAAANAFGVTGKIGEGTLLKNSIGKLDQVTGVSGAVLRTGANMVKLSAIEGLAETYQTGLIEQTARMRIDELETLNNKAAAHRRSEALAGGMFMGGLFGAGGGRRSSQSAQAGAALTNFSASAANAPAQHIRLVVDNTVGGAPNTQPLAAAVLPLHTGPRLGLNIGFGNHPTDRLASGWHMTEEANPQRVQDANSPSEVAAQPKLQFHTHHQSEHQLEMRATLEDGQSLAHIVASRDPTYLGHIEVRFKSLVPMPPNKVAELLARFLGHTKGFLPRSALVIDVNSLNQAKGTKGSLLNDDAERLAPDSYAIDPETLLVNTLSHFGYGTGAVTSYNSAHFDNAMLAPAQVGHPRQAPQFFADGPPGTGPGLADPQSFTVIKVEPLGDIKTIAPQELRRQGSNHIAFGVPSETTEVRASAKPTTRGIHARLLENGDAATAGHTQNEPLRRGALASDVRYVVLNSGHYKPDGTHAVKNTVVALAANGLDAQGRVISLFNSLGSLVSTQPFATLTSRRSTRADGTQIVETYIPKRADPNPEDLRFIPHFRAEYDNNSPDVVHITTLNLADFPEGYLAAFVAQSLAAHDLSPTRQLSVDGLFAYQLTESKGKSLQQQIVAALSALGVKVTGARFEQDTNAHRLRVNFIVDTDGLLAPGEFNPAALASAAQAFIPSRARVTTAESAFTPLKMIHPSAKATKPSDFGILRFAHQDGNHYTTLGDSDQILEAIIVTRVDRYGNMHYELPRATSSREQSTAIELIEDSAQFLDHNKVQVNSIRHSLVIGSADPLAKLFVERTRHHHHNGGKDLREAAQAAAADVLQNATLSSHFGFFTPRDVYISGNLVVIDGQREPSPSTITPARIRLSSAAHTDPDHKHRPQPGNQTLHVLKAHVGEHPSATRAKALIYQALTNAPVDRFRLLAAFLQSNAPVSQLARQLDLDTTALQVTLWQLASQLTQISTLRFKDIKKKIVKLLRPLMAPDQTPGDYLDNIVADPGAWAISQRLTRRVSPTRLHKLDQSELERLQALGIHQFSAQALLIAQGQYTEVNRKTLNAQAAAIRAHLHPGAHTWLALDMAYTGGLNQLLTDTHTELRNRATGQVSHISFPILWKDSAAAGVELLAAKASTWQRHNGSANSVSATLDPLRIRSLTHTHPGGAQSARQRSISAQDQASLQTINQARAQHGASNLRSSARIGPQAHHALYFGPNLTLNARILNELEATRRTISHAMGNATSPTDAQLPSAGAHLKVVGGTAVLRIGARAKDAAPGVIREAFDWAYAHRDHIHTLRIETQAVHQEAFERLVSQQNQSLDGLTFTQEDYYHFTTQVGHYDLTKQMRVATLTLGRTRAQAAAQAHTLTGPDRAFAFQTLYFAGNKAYDQPAHPDAVNLARLLPPPPPHGSHDIAQFADTPQPIHITFNASATAGGPTNASKKPQQLYLALARADAQTHQMLGAYLAKQSIDHIATKLTAQAADGVTISANVVRKRLSQLSQAMFGTQEVAALRENITQALGSNSHAIIAQLISEPRRWADRHLTNLRITRTRLDYLKPQELRVLEQLLAQYLKNTKPDRKSIGHALSINLATVYEHESNAYKKLGIANLNELALRYERNTSILAQDLTQASAQTPHQPKRQPKEALITELMKLSDAQLNEIAEHLASEQTASATNLGDLDGKAAKTPTAQLIKRLNKIDPTAETQHSIAEWIQTLYPSLSQSPQAFIRQLIQAPKQWARTHTSGPDLNLAALQHFSERDRSLIASFIHNEPTRQLAKKWKISVNTIYFEKYRLLESLRALSVDDLVRRAGGKAHLLKQIEAISPTPSTASANAQPEIPPPYRTPTTLIEVGQANLTSLQAHALYNHVAKLVGMPLIASAPTVAHGSLASSIEKLGFSSPDDLRHYPGGLPQLASELAPLVQQQLQPTQSAKGLSPEIPRANLSKMEAKALHQHIVAKKEQEPQSVNTNALNRALRKLGMGSVHRLSEYPGGAARMLVQLRPLVDTPKRSTRASARRAATILHQMTDQQLGYVKLVAAGMKNAELTRITGKSAATIHRTLHPLVQAIDPTKYPKDLPQLLNQLFDNLSTAELIDHLDNHYISWARRYVPRFKPISHGTLIRLPHKAFAGLYQALSAAHATTQHSTFVAAPSDVDSSVSPTVIGKKNRALRQLGVAQGNVDALFRSTVGGKRGFFELLDNEQSRRTTHREQSRLITQERVKALRQLPEHVALLIHMLPRRAYYALLLSARGYTAEQISKKLALSESALKLIQRQISATFALPLDALPQLFDNLYRPQESIDALFERILTSYESWAKAHLPGFEVLNSEVLEQLSLRQTQSLYHTLYGQHDQRFSPQALGVTRDTMYIHTKQALNALGIKNLDQLRKHYPGGFNTLQRDLLNRVQHAGEKPKAASLPFDRRAFDALDTPQRLLLSDLAAGLGIQSIAMLHQTNNEKVSKRVASLLGRWNLSNFDDLLAAYRGKFKVELQQAIRSRGLPELVALTHATDLSTQHRLAWRLLQAGLTAQQISQATDLAVHQVDQLLRSVRNLDFSQTKTHAVLSAAQISELGATLKRGPASEGFDHWSLMNVAQIIYTSTGVNYTVSEVFKVLREFGLLEFVQPKAKRTGSAHQQNTTLLDLISSFTTNGSGPSEH